MLDNPFFVGAASLLFVAGVVLLGVMIVQRKEISKPKK